MKILSFLFFSLLPSFAIAGGDYVVGKISKFSGKNGNYFFHFTQMEKRQEMLSGCREIDVNVNYEKKSWFKELLSAKQPATLEETEKAALFLLNAQLNNQLVSFGYIGYGLVPTDAPCTFLSKGLFFLPSEKNIVFSFHDPF